MRLRNNIFAAAFDEMKRRGIVKKQKELAIKMGVSVDTITRILKDRTEVTEDVITKLQTASGCIFNLQWLRGEDPFHMLAIDVEKLPAANDPIESSSAANAAIAARDEIIANLYAHLDDKDKQIAKLYEDKDEMRRAKDETISELRKRLTEKDESIADLRQRISESKKEIVNRVAMLEKQIADKDDMIAILNQHITDLKIRLSRHDTEDLNKYPFPVGTADSQNPMKKRAKK